MKFLAILRDSLREAIDVKVFYVMVALSGLLTLFAFSISFSPRPAQDTFYWVANTSLNADLLQTPEPENLLAAFMLLGKMEACDVGQVEALDESRHPADSRYRFVLRRHKNVAQLGFGSKNIEQRLRDQLGRLGSMRMVEVTEVKRVPGRGEEAYEVTVAPTSATRRIWLHDTSILFGLVPVETDRGLPIGFQLYFIESGLVIGIGGWVALLISIIITAFFIPNMLRKGTIEPLLVKPMRRWQLLVYKYIGGLAFIFVNTLIAIGGVWLALSIRSGLWPTGFLLTIFILTFFFAILYAVSTLFGVLTQSPVASILLTCGAWLGLFIVGAIYQHFESRHLREERRAQKEHREPEPEGWFPGVVRGLHFVLPRTGDLNVLNAQLLSRELLSANQMTGQELNPVRVNWGESLTVSFIFIVVALGLACWRFSLRDH